MTLTLLPAVDVAEGRAVRLVQGAADTETAHGDPLDAALGCTSRVVLGTSALDDRGWCEQVIASGGISSIDDLVVLADVAATAANLEGAVVGAALYAGNFTLPEALEAVRSVDDSPS